MFGRKLKECSGVEVEVIDPGRLNTDSGPDFFNSKIKVGGVEWAGNIEIHVRASDWMHHGHQDDPAYDNIILHVVGISDKRIRRNDGSLIPQVEITLPPDFFKVYSDLESRPISIRCAESLASISPLTVTDWLETLSVERVQQKSERVMQTLKACDGDWEQTCFITLARALGFGLNSDPFEMLARSVPLRILHHHSDNPLQIQAILFGQAAMLDASNHIFDEYYQLLCREYYFLARKYGLRPMRPGLWKYARTRPQNFPHRRVAFLAKACENGFSLLRKIIDTNGDEKQLRELFRWSLTGYWHSHFSFDTPAARISDTLSDTSVTLLLINVAAPLIYATAAHRSDTDLAEKALTLLESLPAEFNSITREWAQYGLHANDALRSQSLIHLKKNYCDQRKCLSCRFGHHLLRQSALGNHKRETQGIFSAL